MFKTWEKLFSLKTKYLPSGTFKTNVLTLLTGTTIVQVISILLSPIIARLYTANDFGLVALFNSLVAMFGIIVTGRYELTILLPSKNKDAFNLVVLSILVTASISILTFIIILLFHSQIIFLLKNKNLSPWLYVVPFSIFLTGIYQALNYWFNRLKKFKDLATTTIIQYLSNTFANIGFGLLRFNAGMIIGNIIGQLIALIRLGKSFVKEWKTRKNNISIKRIKVLALRYKEFPQKSSIGAFFNSISYQIEYILLSVFFGLPNLGNYYFANRIASMPNGLLSSAIWPVFLSENSGKSKQLVYQELKHYQQKVFSLISLPMFSILFIITDLWKIIFGENMISAVNYFYPLLISSHVNLLVASFSLFTILNRPDAEMIFNIMLATFKAIAIVISYYLFNNSLLTVISLSLVQFLMFFSLGSWNYVQLGCPYYHFFVLYFKNILRITPYLLLFLLIKTVFANFILLLIILIFCNIYHWAKNYEKQTKY